MSSKKKPKRKLPNPNIAEHGKPYRFTSENQPKNSGRKGYLKVIEEKVGFKIEETQLDRNNLKKILKVMLEMDVPHLKKVKRSKKAPVLMVNLASAMIRDIERGYTFTIDTMLDRVFGKPVQPTDNKSEISVKDGNIDWRLETIVEDIEDAEVVDEEE